MMTYEALLAFAMLFSPTAAAEAGPFLSEMRVSALALALEEEIMDPREVSYYMSSGIPWTSDTQVLAERMQEFSKYPRIAECDRLPSRQTIQSYLELNSRLRAYVVSRIELNCGAHREELSQALAEIDQLRSVWIHASEAQSTFFYITTRRKALAQFRTVIGDEAFYLGRWPPPVPLWCFDEVR